jgi:hypothetical protein
VNCEKNSPNNKQIKKIRRFFLFAFATITSSTQEYNDKLIESSTSNFTPSKIDPPRPMYPPQENKITIMLSTVVVNNLLNAMDFVSLKNQYLVQIAPLLVCELS